MDSIPDRLISLYKRNGYVRRPNPQRRADEKSRYKKGWELRLVLKNDSEMKEVGDLLKRSGIEPGSAFKKSKQWVQPLYGKEIVEEFEAASQ